MVTKSEELPNYKLETDGENTVIFDTSLVSDPATGFDFLKFNKTNVEQKSYNFARIERGGYQRMISGVWFAPDTKYFRADTAENGDIRYYTVEYSKENLRDSLLDYIKAGMVDNVTVEHNGKFLEGFRTVEHWIYNGYGTVSPIFGLSLYDLGYNEEDIKIGTIFKTVYVSDEEFWNNQILTGVVKGFSIGGLFDMKLDSVGLKTFFSKNDIDSIVSVEVNEEVENVTEVETDETPTQSDELFTKLQSLLNVFKNDLKTELLQNIDDKMSENNLKFKKDLQNIESDFNKVIEDKNVEISRKDEAIKKTEIAKSEIKQNSFKSEDGVLNVDYKLVKVSGIDVKVPIIKK